MAKASNRRCFHYNIDGDPIKGGCPKRSSNCGFYHPEEEGWANARITVRGSKKRRRSLTPSPYGFRRDQGYPRSRQSRSRSRSRTPVRRSRHDSIASSAPESPRTLWTGRPMESSDSRKISINETASSNNMNKGPQQQAQSSTSSTLRSISPKAQVSSSSSLLNPTVSLPTPPLTALQLGGFGDVSLPRHPRISTSIPTNPRSMLPSSPSSSIHQRWPSLTRSDASVPLAPPLPMGPPPPLPPPPSALSAGVAPMTTVEPTVEEKRAIWEERTRILSESELAREHLAGLEEQHIFALQVVESRYFNNLPEEDKTRLKDQLAELEKQRDEAKRIHEESLEKLFKTGSWPTAPPSSIEDGVEEKHKEVVKYIQELKDTVLRTNGILGEISALKTPPLFLADSDDEGAIMDVDEPSGDTAHRKSLKRRRISEGLEGSGGGAYVSSMPTQEELDEFLERLAHMEGLISTLENDIHEHSHEVREEFGLLVDTKLDEFQVAREQEEKQRVEEEQQQMQYLEHDITLAGEQVGELATEIGDLIIRVGKLEVDVAASRKRRQESFEKVLEVERRLQEYVSTRAADVLAIQTFEKALNAYTSRPPSPPATPVNTLPSFDYVYQSLEEPMVQALRSHLVPAIEGLRKDVEDMVRAKNAELYSTLWNKITVTLKVLEMIQSKINQGDIEPAQSLAENVVRL